MGLAVVVVSIVVVGPLMLGDVVADPVWWRVLWLGWIVVAVAVLAWSLRSGRRR
jgi:hypothetical protein